MCHEKKMNFNNFLNFFRMKIEIYFQLLLNELHLGSIESKDNMTFEMNYCLLFKTSYRYAFSTSSVRLFIRLYHY